MYIYPNNALETIEFAKLLSLIAERTRHEEVKELIFAIKPTDNRAYIENELNKAYEFHKIIYRKEPFPYYALKELRKTLHLLSVEEAVLTEEQVFMIREISVQSNAVIEFLNLHSDKYPALNEACSQVYSTQTIIKIIDRVLDKFGKVKSSASKDLTNIRKQIEIKRREVNRKFERILQNIKKENFLRNFEESYINGRRVLAVVAEYKRKIEGNIISESDTGQTAFVEPLSTTAINDELFYLDYAEKQEILKILRQLTKSLRQNFALIAAQYEMLKHLEMLRCKASFSVETDCSMPHFASEVSINLQDAFHPLLFLQNKAQKKQTIPLNIELNAQQRILVISGPNAGGKSISLKTIGLLQIMFQSGILPTCSKQSSFSIFKKFFLDLGDTQSIEFELSTYSSRLIRMKKFIESADKNSLFLIDEFGTGSDPDLGGAIAEVVLEKLIENQCLGVVTTHYGKIKILGEIHKEIQNASMEFEEKNLKPKYKLVVGRPGRSYTFEVAQNIGMPREIISKAKQKMKSKRVEFDNVLRNYRQKIEELENLKAEQDKLKLEYWLSKQKADEVIANFKEKQRKLIEEQEIQTKLIKAGKNFNALMEEWKTAKNKKAVIDKFFKIEQTQKIKALEKAAVQNTPKKKRKKRPQKVVESKPLEVGDSVRMANFPQKGKILSIHKDSAIVELGNLQYNVKLDKLKAVQQRVVSKIIDEK